MKHIVNLSFGIGSWAAGKLVAQRYGTDDLILLFADTKYEDEDTYRWGREAAANIGGELIEIAEGRTPWQVFFDVRFLGNSRVDPCSRILKRDFIDRWLAEKFPDKAEIVRYVGLHWSEMDRYSRFDKKRGIWRGVKHRLADLGWECTAPLIDWKPWMGYQEMHEWAKKEGLSEQWMYRAGFPHANCGGRCVKQGKGGWKRLWELRPDRYIECEKNEEALRRHLGRDDITIMHETVKGIRIPLTLRDFRERLERKEMPLGDVGNTVGGCKCFDDDEED